MGRARLRCPQCEAILGVWGSRGLEIEQAVEAVQIDQQGQVWLVCRGCRARLLMLKGLAIVRARVASLLS